MTVTDGGHLQPCPFAEPPAFHRLERVPARAKASGLGAVAGLVAWWLPEAVGGGHSTAERILRGEYASLDFLPVSGRSFSSPSLRSLVASYGTGVPGGIFAPMLGAGSQHRG